MYTEIIIVQTYSSVSQGKWVTDWRTEGFARSVIRNWKLLTFQIQFWKKYKIVLYSDSEG